MNFTVLGTAESRNETYMDRYSYLIAEQEQEKDPDAPEKQAGAGDVMSVSMDKGMPFFLKGPDYRDSRSKMPTVLPSERTPSSQTSYRRW